MRHQTTPLQGRVVGRLGRFAAALAAHSSALHVLVLLLGPGQTTPSRVLLGLFALGCGACAPRLWTAPDLSAWVRTAWMSGGIVVAHALVALGQSLGTGRVGALGDLLHPHVSEPSSPIDLFLLALHILPAAQLSLAAGVVAWLSLCEPQRMTGPSRMTTLHSTKGQMGHARQKRFDPSVEIGNLDP